MPNPANPQAWNRYAYVLNNPLKYTDPTGHWIDEGGGFATNKKKNAGLKIVSGRRVGNSDGDGIFIPPSGEGGDDGKSTSSGNCNTCPCTQSYTEKPPLCSGPSIQNTDDFTGFWEFDRINGYGGRLNGTLWIFPIFAVDLSFDLLHNTNSGETDVFFTLSGMGGLGEGFDVSLSGLGLYDAPNNESLEGKGYGAQANVTDVGGLQVGYNYSDQPGNTGKHAQIWSIGPSGGAEASISGMLGWTWMLTKSK